MAKRCAAGVHWNPVAGNRWRCRACHRAYNRLRNRRLRAEDSAAVNAEKRRQYARAPKQYGATSRQWRDDNPLEKKAWRASNKAIWRARAFGVPWERIPTAKLVALMSLQGGRCSICQKLMSAEFMLLHRRPLARGGAHKIRNVAWVCAPCGSRELRLRSTGGKHVAATTARVSQRRIA